MFEKITLFLLYVIAFVQIPLHLLVPLLQVTIGSSEYNYNTFFAWYDIPGDNSGYLDEFIVDNCDDDGISRFLECDSIQSGVVFVGLCLIICIGGAIKKCEPKLNFLMVIIYILMILAGFVSCSTWLSGVSDEEDGAPGDWDSTYMYISLALHCVTSLIFGYKVYSHCKGESSSKHGMFELV